MLKWSFSLFFLVVSLVFGDSGYIIDNYKVDIDINNKNIYSVDENIEVNFLEPRRGIYRILPEQFNGREIKISNLKTNVQTSAKDEGNYIYLRMGDPKRYITGMKDYIIKYNYDIGWDRNTKYDEVYYNLIGNDWDTNINRVEFSIKLPKEFDPSKVNFTLGAYGSTSTSGVKWSVDGNTIRGYTTRVLGPKESVTIALPLPEGYFDVTDQKVMYYLFRGLLYLLYLIVPLIGFFMLKKYGERNEIVEVVEFYPPDAMTPTEVGYYIDGKIDARDLTSLIFYWASKGYLEIDEIKKSGMFSKASFEIIRLEKPFESKNEFEKYMFNSLFLYGASDNRVDIRDLKDVFYKHIQKAAEIFEIDLIMSQRSLYTSKSLRVGDGVKSSVILIAAATFGYFFYFGTYDMATVAISLALGGVSALVTLSLGNRIKKRTEYGNSVIGRVLGFKRFLITTEKRKLEMLLEENPSYFYDILPYTIVLGVSGMWADKFKDLVTQPPNWYRTSSVGDVFVLSMFMSSFNNSLSAFNDSMLSSPKAPSNFGGGSSSMGGGSSGGGAGGGGGGSW
ncbi:DUF2207 domain-containing protein [Cetobacterium sp.]|uniref:DUF2207 domain-containing protein n=1 Tax=Cetobacterium sp. TaxID=2071632 RepID=UPI002FCC25A2